MVLHPIMQQALAPFLATTASVTLTDVYRGWLISFEYPPIPVRDSDWAATHPDYDGAEDANDSRIVHGRTRTDVIAEIDAWFEEQAA